MNGPDEVEESAGNTPVVSAPNIGRFNTGADGASVPNTDGVAKGCEGAGDGGLLVAVVKVGPPNTDFGVTETTPKADLGCTIPKADDGCVVDGAQGLGLGVTLENADVVGPENPAMKGLGPAGTDEKPPENTDVDRAPSEARTNTEPWPCDAAPNTSEVVGAVATPALGH